MRCFHQTGFWKDKICVILINVVLCVQVVGTLLTSNNEKGACHHRILKMSPCILVHWTAPNDKMLKR